MKFRKMMGVTAAFLCAALALSGCGSTGETAYRIGIVQQDVFLFAGTILDNIRYGRPVATDQEVMEAARAYSAEIHPVYGRSIWDASLGSYSYDTYETWQEDMYLWMSHLETTGETEYLRTDENTTTEAGGRKIDFAACLDSAGKAGIDYILLPEDLSEDVQKELQEAADGRLRSFGGYFLIVM